MGLARFWQYKAMDGARAMGDLQRELRKLRQRLEVAEFYAHGQDPEGYITALKAELRSIEEMVTEWGAERDLSEQAGQQDVEGKSDGSGAEAGS